MKTVLKLVLIGLSITFILSGCGGGGDDSPKSGKLTIESVELK